MTKDQQAEKREMHDLPMYRLKCPHWYKGMKVRKERKRKETRKKKLKMETENNYTEVKRDKPFINHQGEKEYRCV